jgi:superfamily II DNA or RNA helicase
LLRFNAFPNVDKGLNTSSHIYTMNTYLGQKGYTIPKNEISIEKQKQIKTDLTIRPYIPGAPPGTQNTFPAYRESGAKLYVPHYYGVEQFGPPKENKVSEGQDVVFEFKGTLRDYQAPVVGKFIKTVTASGQPSGGLLELPCAWGKTSASLYIMSQLKKKTIVIVHKEFLMNQWIERIAQFVPAARIGKIQGPTVDVEDKDIVLCMLQSLINKEYPAELFSQFGLTIIDEVHHISSQTFSNSLFKVVTKYMLGLSATMDRKDGTTKVFKMFLGPVIHKVERKNEHEVEVRAMTYRTNDAEFNDTILDFKGQPQISSMISKLSSYNRRTEFIIQTLTTFISANPPLEKVEPKIDTEHPPCCLCNKSINYLVRNTCCDQVKYCLLCMDAVVKNAKDTLEQTVNKKTGEVKQVKRRPKCPCCSKVLAYEQNYVDTGQVKPIHELQTIVLSHNLNVLEYIYQKFVCKNLASVGYYVGGMSEQELKASEKKHVILATYSMASEGLDIPGLNAEFLISPKTDIVQSVGRILRAKHATTQPVIYDFVDTHDVFQRQWRKRKTFYKKQNYKIVGYDGDKCTTIFEPGVCKPNKSDSSDEDEDDTKANGCLFKPMKNR